MISKLIYDSERFLKMSVSARDLYTYLLLHADDDGVVEAGTVLRLTKGADDDLNLLIYKNLVTMLDPENRVVYINDWLLHNTIRADRKTNSVYKNLLIKILPDVKMIEKKQRTDRIPKIEQVQKEIVIENEKEEECISSKILSFFKKYNIDENTLKIFKKKFNDELILKQLKNLEINIKRGIKIANVPAWLFVACDRDYPLKAQDIKESTKKILIVKDSENDIEKKHNICERKRKQLESLENDLDLI